MHRSRVIVWTFALAAAMAAGVGNGWPRAAAQTPPASQPSAEEIYLRAVKAMRALPVPRYAIFRADYWARNSVVTCGSDGLDLSIRHGDSFSAFRVWYRASDQTAVSVDPHTNARCDGTMIAPAGARIEALGATPAPSPSATATADANGPRLIGTVHVESVHFYRVTLAGIETIDGHPTYHLVLEAYQKPFDHPLTGLWIDTSSWLIRRLQAEVAVHLVIASARGSFVGSFERYGQYWILDNEHIEFAANATLVHLRSTINVRASELSFPSELPGVFPSPRPSAGRR